MRICRAAYIEDLFIQITFVNTIIQRLIHVHMHFLCLWSGIWEILIALSCLHKLSKLTLYFLLNINKISRLIAFLLIEQKYLDYPFTKPIQQFQLCGISSFILIVPMNQIVLQVRFFRREAIKTCINVIGLLNLLQSLLNHEGEMFYESVYVLGLEEFLIVI